MKQTFYNSLLFLSLCFFSACAKKASLAKEGIILTEGSDLIYEVTSDDEKYPFEININQFDDRLISFDWDMDNGTRRGSIAMYDDALIYPKSLFNYFSGGYDDLKDQTAVWISTVLFKDLKSGKLVEIDLGRGIKESFQLQGSETWSFGTKPDFTSYNIPVFIVATKDHKKEIWIADDPQNRLIVMMNIDFRIDLVDFKPY